MSTKLPVDTLYSIVGVAAGVASFAISLYSIRRNRLAAFCFGGLGAAILALCFLLSWITRQPTLSFPRPHVLYFVKTVDRQTVVKAIQATKLTFEFRSPVVADTPTNMIWVGDSVSLDDTKTVALALLGAGVGIKGIRRMLNGGATKATLIEVGSYSDLDAAAVLTDKAVKDLHEIELDTPESWNLVQVSNSAP